jgi:exodeoxyribonuclease V alpha subunit
LGEVAHVGDSAIDVDFRYPDRSVSIKRKDHHLVLAYCLTIHKMQGSEAPVIILPLHSSFGGFFNRELVYTGISRARDICITIGQWEALLAASGRVGNARRRTRLVELLKGDPGAAMDHTGEAGASPSGNPIGNKSGSDW